MFDAGGIAATHRSGGFVTLTVILTAHRDFIHVRFAEEPNLPLRRLQQELADRGVKVSYGAIWTFVHAEEYCKLNAPMAQFGNIALAQAV